MSAIYQSTAVHLTPRRYTFASLAGENAFEPLIKRSEEVLKSTQEMGLWFKKLSLMYDTHAKALQKNSGLTSKKKSYATSIETGSLLSAWRCFHLQLENLGNVQLNVSKELQIEADKIGNFVLEKTNSRKKLVGEANKSTAELKAAISALQKAKSIYDAKCKDADTSQQAYLKAKQDGNTKPKKVQELLSRSTKALDAAHIADKEYQRALERANEKQSRFYETEMPSIMEMFQSFEEERLGFLKGTFQRVAEIQNTLPPAFQTSAEEYIQVSDDLTVSGDIQEYIEENLAAVVTPDTLQYVPYETDNPNFKMDPPDISFTPTTKSPAPVRNRTDSAATKPTKIYGLTEQEEVRLSREEKIMLLQAQVGELQEIIKAEINSKKGMEKLVKFYSKDPKSQEKSTTDLEEQIQKIESLKNTKRDLERLLLDLDPPPSSPAPIPTPPPMEQDVATPVEQDYVCKARALYDYNAALESELSFKGNDILTITEQDASGWWFGELNGKTGFIPSNYMKVLPE